MKRIVSSLSRPDPVYFLKQFSPLRISIATLVTSVAYDYAVTQVSYSSLTSLCSFAKLLTITSVSYTDHFVLSLSWFPAALCVLMALNFVGILPNRTLKIVTTDRYVLVLVESSTYPIPPCLKFLGWGREVAGIETSLHWSSHIEERTYMTRAIDTSWQSKQFQSPSSRPLCVVLRLESYLIRSLSCIVDFTMNGIYDVKSDCAYCHSPILRRLWLCCHSAVL